MKWKKAIVRKEYLTYSSSSKERAHPYAGQTLSTSPAVHAAGHKTFHAEVSDFLVSAVPDYTVV